MNRRPSDSQKHHLFLQPALTDLMASSGQPGFDLSQAVAIINVLRQTGMWEQALIAADRAAIAQSDVEPSSSMKGSMHDGSKRRLFADDETEEFDLISMAGTEVAKQVPILPSTGATNVSSKDYELPPGVESVEMWGKTICTLPKVAPRRYTYEKLIAEAGQNAETKNYLAWIYNHSDKSAKAADLKKYMEVTKFDPCEVKAVNYPGTSAVREFGM